MPEAKLKCNACIPERHKHTYILDKSNPIIPACNTKTVPGDMTERGCAYAGARGVVGGPITDCIHMIHAPVGCSFYTWGTRRNLSDLYGWATPDKLCNEAFMRRHSFTTDMSEKDVIYGGMDKLKNACLEAFRLTPGAKGLFIYTTCTTALIGDDVKSIAREVEEEVGKPVFAIESPGLCGVSQSKGHHEFNFQFYRQIVEYRKKHPEVCLPDAEKTDYDINLIGEYNMDWDVKFIKPLFEDIGCRIVSVFTGNSRIEELFKIPDAKLSVVHCQRSATYIAELVKQGFDVPHIPVSLFGIEQTSNALRKVAEFFDSPEMKKKVEEVIEREMKAITPALNFYREKLKGKKVGIYVGGPRVWHWVKVMEELGMEVVFCMCTFAHQDDYQKINARARDGVLVIDNPNEFEIEEALHTYTPDVFLCGLKERYLTRKFGITTVNSHSYDKGPYAGFRGLINFARDIYEGIYAPVWKFLKEDL